MTSDVCVILYLLMYGYQCKYYVQFATGDLLFLHRSLRSHKAFFYVFICIELFSVFLSCRNPHAAISLDPKTNFSGGRQIKIL